MKLKDWLPKEFFSEWIDHPLHKFLDYDVIKDNTEMSEKEYFACPIKRKHIYCWCIISNGKKEYAVGWNENPAIGWSFPYKRLNLVKKIKPIMLSENDLKILNKKFVQKNISKNENYKKDEKTLKEKFTNVKNKYDYLRWCIIVGHIDSYDAVHSVAIHIDDDERSDTHIDLFGPQCTKRWRWSFDRNLDFSIYNEGDGKPTIEDLDAIERHLTREYDIRWQENGWHDWQYFVSKMSKK